MNLLTVAAALASRWDWEILIPYCSTCRPDCPRHVGDWGEKQALFEAHWACPGPSCDWEGFACAAYHQDRFPSCWEALLVDASWVRLEGWTGNLGLGAPSRGGHCPFRGGHRGHRTSCFREVRVPCCYAPFGSSCSSYFGSKD